LPCQFLKIIPRRTKLNIAISKYDSNGNEVERSHYNSDGSLSNKTIYKEDLGDKQGMGDIIGNIGIVYFYKGDYDKALDYLERSIGIKEEIGNKSGLVTSLSNLGVLYKDKGYIDKSMVYYERSLAISEELGNIDQIGLCLGNIESAYTDKGDYDKALTYFDRSLAINEEIGDKGIMIYNYFQIGIVHYFKKTDFELAAEYFEKSQAIIDEIGTGKQLMIYTRVLLYLTYKQLGKTYDVQEIFELLYKVENIDLDLNFHLYELLEDKSYLEKAYEQIQALVETMEDDIKDNFLSYPIPKSILEKYNKVRT